MGKSMRIDLPAPSEKQRLFLTDKHKYVGFGGARGGGKSFAVRLKAIALCCRYAGYKCMIVRKTYPELTENHIKPIKALLHVGTDGAAATYNDAKKEVTFPNGSVILFRYCSNERDVDRFQGLETDALFIDEATQIPEDIIKRLYACVRGTTDVPRRVYLTCNPGGVSHQYIKRIFIDKKYTAGEDAADFSFIQSLLTDNMALQASNPEYVKQLESLPPALRKAWLEGRWDVFEGAFFSEFRVEPEPQACHDAGITVEMAADQHRWTHVIAPFVPPKDWKVYRSYDWGYGKPFACTWYAVDYSGCAYMILELYGCTETPNEGVKWSNAEQFDRIAEIERDHPYLAGRRIMGVADPSIWDGSHGISAADEADKHGLWFVPGVNARIPGWMQVRERLKFDAEGHAMLYIFDTCKETIRTMPLQMFDEHRPEDLDSSLEDHIQDTIRYFCMQHVIAPRIIEDKTPAAHDPLNQYADVNKAKWR